MPYDPADGGWCDLSSPAPRPASSVSQGTAAAAERSVYPRVDGDEEGLVVPVSPPPCLPGPRDNTRVASLLTTRCCQNLPRHAASTLFLALRVETIYNDFPYYSSSNNLINVPNMVLLVCL